jgi:membrane associated rhomboid family serine protease
VKLWCLCGAALSVPASAAGRKAKCPKCGAVLAIPQTATSADQAAPTPGGDFELALQGLASGQAVSVGAPPSVEPAQQRSADGFELYDFKPPEPKARLEEEASAPAPAGPPKTCPSCHKQFPGSAKICVDCGIDLRTGRALLTTQDDNLDRIYTYAENVIRWISWLIMMGVYPIASEAFGLRKPWVTRGIAAVTILVSAWFMVAFIYNPHPSPSLAGLMLWGGHESPRPAAQPASAPASGASADDAADDESDEGPAFIDPQYARFHVHQLFTHLLLHVDPLHLAGNLLFLMVLGARVNALIGNLLTLVLYPVLGLAAALAQGASTAGEPPHPCLGASGAVMGLAGMYLILFPIHKVHMAFWWRWGFIGGFHLHLKLFVVRGFWVVLFFIAFDVLYTVLRVETGVAHWAHIGGFLAGVSIALLLLFTRLINARGGDILTALLKHRAWALIGHPNRPSLRLW